MCPLSSISDKNVLFLSIIVDKNLPFLSSIIDKTRGVNNKNCFPIPRKFVRQLPI